MNALRRRTAAALALAAAALAACSKDAPPSGGPAPTLQTAMPVMHPTGPEATASPTASGAASAAAPTVAASAAAAKPGVDGGASSDEDEAPAASASAPAKTFKCGAKGQPMCPMQSWMKGHMPAAVADGDGPELGKLFDYIAAHPPPGFGSWSSIAKDGAAKARANDIDGAKAACKSCHQQYKAKYKTEMRDRPF
jgi:hypothetical protein